MIRPSPAPVFLTVVSVVTQSFPHLPPTVVPPLSHSTTGENSDPCPSVSLTVTSANEAIVGSPAKARLLDSSVTLRLAFLVDKPVTDHRLGSCQDSAEHPALILSKVCPWFW